MNELSLCDKLWNKKLLFLGDFNAPGYFNRITNNVADEKAVAVVNLWNFFSLRIFERLIFQLLTLP